MKPSKKIVGIALGAAAVAIAVGSLTIAGASQSGARPETTTAVVLVPAGTFTMGASDGAKDEQPPHRVTVGAFAIDLHEVTNERFAACVRAGKCEAPKLSSSQTRKHYFGNPEYADYPAIFVDHTQATAFCAWSNGRLPTEAEWEHAARGDDGRNYPWGNAEPTCTLANFGGPNGCVGDTDRVGARPRGASPYGVLDLAGNVWEWTADRYDANYYGRSPEADPKGSEDGRLRVMRGGCFQSGASSLRSTCRKPELPATWAPNVGFRCVYPASFAKGGAR